MHSKETKPRIQAKMTVKCAMDFDVQKLSLAHPCDHFDTYLTCRAQNGRKLQHVEISTILPTPKIRKFWFGHTVRFVQFISA